MNAAMNAELSAMLERIREHLPTQAEIDAYEAEQEQSRRRSRLSSMPCPPMARDNDPERLRREFPVLHRRVTAWTHGPRGLMVCGRSRAGKTRCTSELVARLILRDGRKVRAMRSTELAMRIGLLAKDPSELMQFQAGLEDCDTLWIDDLGKETLAPWVRGIVFGILDSRMANGKPVLVTTNLTDAELVAHFGARHGAPLVARLTEACEVIRA